MKRIVAIAAVAIFATTALGQPYYVRGDFNGWTNNSDPMVDMGGGMWSYTISNPSPNPTEFKATVDDWSFNAPGSNAKWQADGSGEINVNFFPSTSWADGWMPDNKARLGFADHGLFDWEIAGEMNGWNGGVDWYLTDMGGGLHMADILMTANATYQFKFRKQGSWDFNTGDDLGNSAANNSVTVNAGETWRFELDLPNGRWRTTLVPEPASFVLLALGGLAALRRR